MIVPQNKKAKIFLSFFYICLIFSHFYVIIYKVEEIL
jgi:hypothetical protein